MLSSLDLHCQHKNVFYQQATSLYVEYHCPLSVLCSNSAHQPILSGKDKLCPSLGMRQFEVTAQCGFWHLVKSVIRLTVKNDTLILDKKWVSRCFKSYQATLWTCKYSGKVVKVEWLIVQSIFLQWHDFHSYWRSLKIHKDLGQGLWTPARNFNISKILAQDLWLSSFWNLLVSYRILKKFSPFSKMN